MPSVALLIGVTALMPLGMHVVLPAIPTIARALSAPVPTIQLTVTLYLAVVAVAQLVYGPLSDRFGRKPLLIAGLAVTLAGTLVCAAATSAALLLGGRMIQGAGACAGMVLARAMLRDVYPPERSAVLQAQLSSLVIIAPMAAAIFGGLLITWAGWRVPFFVLAALAAALLVRVLRIDETHLVRHARRSVPQMLRDFVALLGMRQFAAAAGSLALSSGCMFAYLSEAPGMFENALGIPPSRYGLYLAVMPIAFGTGSFLASRLIPRFGSRRVALAATYAIVASALGVLGAALTLELSPATLLVPMVLFNLSQVVAVPALTTAALSADPAKIGAASGLMGFLMMAVSALATQLMSVMHDGTALPLGVLIAVLGVLSAVAARWSISADSALPATGHR